MNALEMVFDNFFVQVFVGIGLMVFLIAIGEAFARMLRPLWKKQTERMVSAMKEDLQGQIEALRQEVRSARSTVLDHSMSLESNVETLVRRVERLEQTTSQRGVG